MEKHRKTRPETYRKFPRPITRRSALGLMGVGLIGMGTTGIILQLLQSKHTDSTEKTTQAPIPPTPEATPGMPFYSISEIAAHQQQLYASGQFFTVTSEAKVYLPIQDDVVAAPPATLTHTEGGQPVTYAISNLLVLGLATPEDIPRNTYSLPLILTEGQPIFTNMRDKFDELHREVPGKIGYATIDNGYIDATIVRITTIPENPTVKPNSLAVAWLGIRPITIPSSS